MNIFFLDRITKTIAHFSSSMQLRHLTDENRFPGRLFLKRGINFPRRHGIRALLLNVPVSWERYVSSYIREIDRYSSIL